MNHLDNLLEEIEQNPIQKVETLEENPDSQSPPVVSVVSVDLLTRKAIIMEWLNGDDPRTIGNRHNLTTQAVKKIIDTNAETRQEIEKQYFSVAAARENYRISETKNNLINYINDALTSVMNDGSDMTPEKKVKFLNNIAMIFDKLDNTSRLNDNKPTSRTEHHDLKIDIAELMKQFQTPEEKLAFLQNQSNKLKKVYEGQVVGTE